MILKLMDDSVESERHLFDDNPLKSCQVLSDIAEVKTTRLTTGEYCLDVTYHRPRRDLVQEQFVLRGNAYLMNDNGKTIQTFSYVAVASNQG